MVLIRILIRLPIRILRIRTTLIIVLIGPIVQLVALILILIVPVALVDPIQKNPRPLARRQVSIMF